MAIVLNHQLSINDRFFRMYLDYPVLFHFFVHLHQKTTFEEYATQVFTGRMSYLSAYRLRQSASHWPQSRTKSPSQRPISLQL